ATRLARSGVVLAPSSGLNFTFELAGGALRIAAPVAPTLQELLHRSVADGPPELAPPPPVPRRLSSEFGVPTLHLARAAEAQIDLDGSQPVQAFQPSSEFQGGSSELRARAAADQGLPPGISSPVVGANSPVWQNPVDEYPGFDLPKEVAYSLEAGNVIKSYSSAQQDVKLLTQVFQNISSGFYLESNAGDGEFNSNTLLLEMMGWRGLLLEPRVVEYLTLWSKFRKAWLFLGSISPQTPRQHHEAGTHSIMVGFDTSGKVDQLSGHKVPTYPIYDFMYQMGGRKTVDFWSLRNGGFEAETLNATFNGTTDNCTGQGITFGVIMVSIQERLTGRGNDDWVVSQSRDLAEQRIFSILVYTAGYSFIGGLDPQWINTVVPRYRNSDYVFVCPSYFEQKGLAVPAAIKSAPPPPLPLGAGAWDGFDSWDPGLTQDQEVAAVQSYIELSRTAAAPAELVPRAHRTQEVVLR
ncbi:unnamed protein product, partial [Prorocentrum cordatum]